MAERITLWTRLTDRANVLVWALPLPHRALAALSRIVYRNPPMPAKSVVRALEALDRAEVSTIVMGGWGIDALVGKQQRTHHDLDLIVDCKGIEAALETLAGLGYEEWFRDTSPVPYGEHRIDGDVVVVRDAAFRVVDLHPMRIGDSGPSASAGEISGYSVQCVSPELQIEAHSGYRMRWPSGKRHREINLATAQRALETAEPVGASSGSRALAQQSPDLA